MASRKLRGWRDVERDSWGAAVYKVVCRVCIARIAGCAGMPGLAGIAGGRAYLAVDIVLHHMNFHSGGGLVSLRRRRAWPRANRRLDLVAGVEGQRVSG